MTRKKWLHVQVFTRAVQGWKYHWVGWLVLGLLTSLLTVACSRNLPTNLTRQSQPAASDSCRLVTHLAGEMTVCGQPQKVAALSPRVLNAMLALDIQPEAYAEASLLKLRRFNNPSEQIPILGEYVTTHPINLGDRDVPSLEALTLLNPDLIVGETWHDYELFSKIAPTLLLDYPLTPERWYGPLQVLAQVFGREEQAEQVIARYHQQVAKVRAIVAPVRATYPRILTITTNQRFEPIFFNALGAESLKRIGFQPLLLEQYPEGQRLSLEALA